MGKNNIGFAEPALIEATLRIQRLRERSSGISENENFKYAERDEIALKNGKKYTGVI